MLYAAENPPYGAVFSYYLNEGIKSLKQKRIDAEKAAEKAGRPIRYPTPEELRAEAEEEAPARYRNLVRAVRQVLEAASEDVGDRFPEEARKIHYKEVEQRAIRGTASSDEARELVEEGVEIMALPRLPEKAN